MTIAVDDLPRTVQIYENMGWQTPPKAAAYVKPTSSNLVQDLDIW